jgi:hypothetical protein
MIPGHLAMKSVEMAGSEPNLRVRAGRRPEVDVASAGTCSRLPTLSMIVANHMGTVVMRRRLKTFLPIVLIALLVQIFAPISASWATSAALSDPFGGSAAICAASADSGTGHPDQSGQHADCYVLCCLAHAGSMPLDTPHVTVAKPFALSERVIWFEAVNNLSTFRTGLLAQARAPPSQS